MSPQANPAPAMGKAALILACLVLAGTNFMVVLDTTIANVAVAHIAGALGISSTEGTWVITSYAVAEAMAGFGLFSMLCGMAVPNRLVSQPVRGTHRLARAAFRSTRSAPATPIRRH